MATAITPGIVGSQALLDPTQIIYLRQTDPTLDIPLGSAYGGLDNRMYNTGDFLVNNGSTFIILPLDNSGDILEVDLTRPIGVKWSSDLSVALSNIEYYNTQKLVIQNNINLLNDEYLSLGVNLSSIALDEQQLQNDITSLTLYVTGQQESITSIATALISLNISINDTIITINNLQAGLNAINIRVGAVNTSYNSNITTITNLSNIINQSSTNLQNQQLTATGTINRLTNSNFTIWQRGTVFGPANNTNNYLTADRWYHCNTHGGILSSSQTLVTLADNTVVTGLLLNVTGNTSNFFVAQLIENVQSLLGTMTISIWLQAAVSTSLVFNVVQSFGVGGSPDVVVFTDTINFTNITNYVSTFTFPSISGKTINSGSYIKIMFTSMNWTNVAICRMQLQNGSSNLTYEEKEFQVDLLICQRYYESGTHIYAGYIDSNQVAYNVTQYNVEKYAAVRSPVVTIIPVTQSLFTTIAGIGPINNTKTISSSRQKTNVTSFGSFKNTFITDAEIYI